MAEKEKKPPVDEKPEQKAVQKCTAPDGFKELAPGKSFCSGGRNFKGGVKKSCYVPEIMLKGIKVKEGTFLSK